MKSWNNVKKCLTKNFHTFYRSQIHFVYFLSWISSSAASWAFAWKDAVADNESTTASWVVSSFGKSFSFSLSHDATPISYKAANSLVYARKSSFVLSFGSFGCCVAFFSASLLLASEKTSCWLRIRLDIQMLTRRIRQRQLKISTHKRWKWV